MLGSKYAKFVPYIAWRGDRQHVPSMARQSIQIKSHQPCLEVSGIERLTDAATGQANEDASDIVAPFG